MNLQTFFDNFELLAEAPNGVRKLRELVLYLAMRGKLETQSPNDEASITILKQIHKKKNLENQKIKKRNSNTEVDSITCEGLFEIPATWCWSYLNCICEQIGDIDHKMPQAVDVGVPFLSAKDLKDDGTLDFSNPKYISEEDFERLSRKIKPKLGDIIYSRIGAKLGKARLVEVDKEFLISYSCCLIRPLNQCINNKYLQLFLDSRLALNQAHVGTQSIGVPDLGLGVIKQYKIPIPPLAEQNRIVSKVDQLMKLCDQLEARQQKKREARVTINNTAIAQLLTAREPEEFNKSWQRIYNNFDLLYSTPENIGKLRSCILQLAVMGKLAPQDPSDEPAFVLIERIKTKKEQLIKEKKIKNSKPLPQVKLNQIPYELPNNWKWVCLDDISDIGTGSTPLTSTIEYYENGNIPWITSSATSQDFIYSAESHITSLAVSDYRLRIYKPNTLIVALYGQGKTRGQVSELKIAATINQACAAISFFEPSEELGKYIKQVFRKKYDELRELAAGGAQPNLNLGHIKETLIPLPPLAEQHRIIVKINQLMTLCDQLEAQLKQSVADSERLMEIAVHQLLDINTSAVDNISVQPTKLETKTVKQSSKKTQLHDGEAVQLNLPLF